MAVGTLYSRIPFHHLWLKWDFYKAIETKRVMSGFVLLNGEITRDIEYVNSQCMVRIRTVNGVFLIT